MVYNVGTFEKRKQKREMTMTNQQIVELAREKGYAAHLDYFRNPSHAIIYLRNRKVSSMEIVSELDVPATSVYSGLVAVMVYGSDS